MAQLEQPQTTRGRATPLGAAAVFLVAYLLVGPMGGLFADRELPLPDAPAAQIAEFYTANPAAALVAAALQLLSVAGLGMFAAAVAPRSRALTLARVGVAAMVVSCLFTGVLTVLAGTVADETVAMLRLMGFYAGGVVHVVALGAFALLAAARLYQSGSIGRFARTFGYMAGALAVLSVLSVAVYYASVLLPVGRVLCMLWAVAAGVSWWRRHR